MSTPIGFATHSRSNTWETVAIHIKKSGKILLQQSGCPPHPGCYILRSRKISCNLPHKSAALADLCFRTGDFANGTTAWVTDFQTKSLALDPCWQSCASPQIFSRQLIKVGFILWEKTECFFGKIMLPECTCGKFILPFFLQFIILDNSLRVNRGNLMLSALAILWVKWHDVT